jgi:hypothetical protein
MVIPSYYPFPSSFLLHFLFTLFLYLCLRLYLGSLQFPSHQPRIPLCTLDLWCFFCSCFSFLSMLMVELDIKTGSVLTNLSHRKE